MLYYKCAHIHSNCVCFNKVSGVLFLVCVCVFPPPPPPRKRIFQQRRQGWVQKKKAQIDPPLHVQAAEHNYTP